MISIKILPFLFSLQTTVKLIKSSVSLITYDCFFVDIGDGLPNNPHLKCTLCAQRLEDTHFVQVITNYFNFLQYWSISTCEWQSLSFASREAASLSFARRKQASASLSLSRAERQPLSLVCREAGAQRDGPLVRVQRAGPLSLVHVCVLYKYHKFYFLVSYCITSQILLPLLS